MVTISTIFKKAVFPAIMTILFFILFLISYWIMITDGVQLKYLVGGLLLAIPVVIFGRITFLTTKGRLKTVSSSVLTGVLIPVLGFFIFYFFVSLMFSSALAPIEDISKYEQVLKESGFPENENISFFPPKIPQGATDVKFYHSPAFLQGGGNTILKFKTNSEEINQYADEFSTKAKGVNTYIEEWTTFESAGYPDGLPRDFMTYLLDDELDEICLVAISTQRNEIIFYEENW